MIKYFSQLLFKNIIKYKEFGKNKAAVHSFEKNI